METRKSFNNIVIMFGGLYAILGIIFMFVASPTADPKATSSVVLNFLSLLIFIGIPVLAVRYYRNQGYQVSLGKAVKLGVLVGLLGGLLVGIYAYIYYSFINPEAVEQVLELSRKVLEENGMLNDEMIEKQMETTTKFFAPMQIVGQTFSGLLYGVIGGLLGGLFFKTPTEDY